jgi:hypothetical protein
MPSSRTVSSFIALATLSTTTAQTFPYPKPTVRYTAWQKLTSTQKDYAQNDLGYTGLTWNVHGFDPVEQLGWWQFSDTQKSGATSLGFSETTWDCFINHYQSYLWAELESEGVQSSYEVLGWTEGSWDGSDTHPESESKWWGQLSAAEIKAANNICYFEDNWNMMDMTPNPTYFPFPFPDFRYVPWDELSTATQNTASGLIQYNSTNWNMLGDNTAERNTFLNLDGTQRDGALALGFYSHTWDCYMNHYEAYYWDSLYGSLLLAMETVS